MTDAPRLGEFQRIARYFKPLAAGFKGARGLADDAAVFAVPAGMEMVVTTDAMVAGVHFLATDPPADIAAKLLRVNLSDLAAMGAEPLCYTLATAWTQAIDEAWLAAFTGALAADQRRFGIHLAGGDTVSTPGPLTLSLTAMGLVPAGQALARGTARPGDHVFVTGTIGDAALGLQVALGRLTVAGAAGAELVERLRRPTPRLAIGPRLRGLATACIDVSDGLVADFGHLCAESGGLGRLFVQQAPLSPAARGVIAADAGLLATALTGGDDYELLFTAPAGAALDLAALASETGVAITRIGRFEAARSEAERGRVVVEDAAGQPMALTRPGWEHF